MPRSILIIEDDFPVLELYCHILRQEGYEVLSAETGEDGLKIAKLGPDLILLDIMLPIIDGIEVLRRLKSSRETKHIPVIILTNLGQEGVIKQGFEEGAEKYLVKIHHQPKDVVEEINSFFMRLEVKVGYEEKNTAN
jgi:DNA-binding response OmpR family regulator